jgi:tetratricopeptide (TPR) repeat protein
MRRTQLAIVFCLAVAVIGSGGQSFAQGNEAAAAEKARVDFRAGRYQDALDVFAKLYTAHPRDLGYLWGVARCHSALEHPREALNYFKKYVQSPGVTADKRAEAQGYIAELEQQLKAKDAKEAREAREAREREAQTPPPPVPLPVAPQNSAPPPPEPVPYPPPPQEVQDTAPPPPVPLEPQQYQAPERSGGALRVTGWIIGGLGAATLAVAGVFGYQAYQAQEEVESKAKAGGVYDAALEKTDERGRNAETKALVIGGVGAAVLVAGGLLYYLGNHSGDEGRQASAPVTVAPVVSAHDLGAVMRMAF